MEPPQLILQAWAVCNGQKGGYIGIEVQKIDGFVQVIQYELPSSRSKEAQFQMT